MTISIQCSWKREKGKGAYPRACIWSPPYLFRYALNTLFSTYGSTSAIYFTSSPLSATVAVPEGGGAEVLPTNLTLSIDALRFRGGDTTEIRDGAAVSKLVRPGGVKLPLAPGPRGPSGRGPIGDGTVCTLGVCDPDPDPDRGELVVVVVPSGFCGLADRGAEMGKPLTSFLLALPPRYPPGGPNDMLILSFLLLPFLIAEKKPPPPPPPPPPPFLLDVKLDTDCID